MEPVLSSTLQRGQVDCSSLGTAWEVAFTIGSSAVDFSTLASIDGEGLTCMGCSGFFSSNFCASDDLDSFAGILGDKGGVFVGDVIKAEAELNMEEPRPNIFPVTDSAGPDDLRLTCGDFCF